MKLYEHFAAKIRTFSVGGHHEQNNNCPDYRAVYQPFEDRNLAIELSVQGARNCISIGKGVIRALGGPTHVSLKISDTNDSISVFPCDEDDVMSFKVPERLLLDHKCVMRINSKRFVHGIMKSNDLDISRTYTLFGKYLADKNMAVFSLVDGVALRVK